MKSYVWMSACAVCLLAGQVVVAAPFGQNNILITEDNELFEYTPSGVLVQSFSIPHPDTPDHEATDVVVAPDGTAFVRNAASFDNDYFSRLDPATSTWTHVGPHSLDSGNVSDKDLSALGSIAVTQGLRLDMTTGNVTAFDLPGFGAPGEVSWGLDGLLYVLDSGSPRAGVRVLDPTDFSLIRELELRDASGSRLDACGIAVEPGGQIFVADWDGMIYEYTPNAELVQAVATGGFNLTDIDMDEMGNLVVGEWSSGRVFLTDTSLSTITELVDLSDEDGSTDLTYVAFVNTPSAPSTAIPEPGSVILLGLAGVTLAGRRRCRCAP